MAKPEQRNESPAATPALLREFADALDLDRGHDKSMVTRLMRDAADEIDRLRIIKADRRLRDAR